MATNTLTERQKQHEGGEMRFITHQHDTLNIQEEEGGDCEYTITHILSSSYEKEEEKRKAYGKCYCN